MSVVCCRATPQVAHRDLYFSNCQGRLDNVRTVVRSTLVFLVAGLVGPLIRWVTPPTPTGQGLSSSIGDFIYSLVLLLWPAQPLAVIEVNTGRFVAAIASVGANLLLFGVAGGFCGDFFKKPPGTRFGFLVGCRNGILFFA